MKFLPVASVSLIDRIIFETPWGLSVFSHLRIRQWQDRLRESRIIIAVFDPAITDHYIITRPAGRRIGHCLEAQPHFIAGVDQYDSIVDLFEQLANIAITGIVPDQISPFLPAELEPVVIRQFWR